jgi:hypothetical protein
VPTTRAKPTTVEVQPRAQQEAPPRPTPGLGLGLGRKSPPRPTPGLGLGLGKNHVLAQPWVSAPASASEESPSRSTSGLDQPCHEGCIITLLLASSGYEGTRPASHPAYPGNRRWWFPAYNHDVGGSQAPYGSRGGHFFTINRKPNRTEILVFSVVRFGFGFCI